MCGGRGEVVDELQQHRQKKTCLYIVLFFLFTQAHTHTAAAYIISIVEDSSSSMRCNLNVSFQSYSTVLLC